MKWKRTKKGSKDPSRDTKTIPEDDEEEDDSKLEIDESDTEDCGNIQVDDGDEVIIKIRRNVLKNT